MKQLTLKLSFGPSFMIGGFIISDEMHYKYISVFRIMQCLCMFHSLSRSEDEMFRSYLHQLRNLLQGILKGEVSLYLWPPVWLVWISLFCKLKQKLSVVVWLIPNQSKRRSTVQWYFPFCIPCLLITTYIFHVSDNTKETCSFRRSVNCAAKKFYDIVHRAEGFETIRKKFYVSWSLNFHFKNENFLI